MSECVMLAGPVTRLIWARLPRVWTLLLPVEIGVARSASIESIAYCGVWTATLYWMPRGSIQNDGETSLLDAPEFVPPRLVYGIEMLNDDKTPMDFVITVLLNHANLDWRTFERVMKQVHGRGGVLLPMASAPEAERVAQAIATEAGLGRPSPPAPPRGARIHFH